MPMCLHHSAPRCRDTRAAILPPPGKRVQGTLWAAPVIYAGGGDRPPRFKWIQGSKQTNQLKLMSTNKPQGRWYLSLTREGGIAGWAVISEAVLVHKTAIASRHTRACDVGLTISEALRCRHTQTDMFPPVNRTTIHLEGWAAATPASCNLQQQSIHTQATLLQPSYAHVSRSQSTAHLCAVVGGDKQQHVNQPTEVIRADRKQLTQ